MKKEFIFRSSDHFQQCHASTLAYGNGDDIIAAWFAGEQEGTDDVSIWLSRRIDSKWEPVEKVAKVNQEPHWNPVLFNPGNGLVYLYFKTGKTIPGWITWVTESSDGGKSWTKPVKLVPGDITGGRGPVKNKPIALANGDWLAPASIETGDEWSAFCDLSSDQGKTWRTSNKITAPNEDDAELGVIQPTLWESEPGIVHMLLRSTCGSIRRSDSSDGGKTWTPALTTNLPNNNSGIDLTKLDNGHLVLIHNPTDNPRKRNPLILSLSVDNGINWEKVCEVEGEHPEKSPDSWSQKVEFSYPSIISKDNTISTVYTYCRRRIAFAQENF